jgi:hypothetical protein
MRRRPTARTRGLQALVKILAVPRAFESCPVIRGRSWTKDEALSQCYTTRDPIDFELGGEEDD